MNKLAIFVGTTPANEIVTGGERQLVEFAKGLERNGLDVRYISVEGAIDRIISLTSDYKEDNIYIITDYSKRFSYIKFNILCRLKYKFNVVCTVGAFYFDYRTSKIKNAVDYIASYFYLKPANLIFTTGKAVEKKLRGMGCRNKRIVNVYPAIRDTLVEEANKGVRELSNGIAEKKIVLTVGRFHRVKGYDYLLDAAKLCEDSDDVQFLLVGDYERKPDDYYQHIIKRIYDEGLEDKIIIYGKTKNDAELASLYRKSWCYLHTSVWETSPITVCEPLLFEKPVIATDVGGTAEYIKDGVNGLLVASKNGEDIANAIKKLYGDKELYDKLVSCEDMEKRKTFRRWYDVGEEYYKALCEE